MTVTVVVPTLGASPLLGACLRALRTQRVQEADGRAPEIVLVAQGAAPLGPGGETGDEKAEELADRVLRPPRNLGFAAATNRGLAVASGPYVATVNDDVVVADGWLAALVEALEAAPGAASAQGVNLQGPFERSGEPPVDGWGLAWDRALQAVQLGRGASPPPPSDPPFPVFGVSATAALYRRDALRRVARPVPSEDRSGDRSERGVPEIFDTRLESYYEDVELACRLRAAGYDALSVPAARAFHAGSLTGRRLGAHRWRLLYGNRWAVAATLPSLAGGGLWRRAPRMASRDLADLARAVVRGDGAKTKGIVGGWRRALRLVPAFRSERAREGRRR